MRSVLLGLIHSEGFFNFCELAEWFIARALSSYDFSTSTSFELLSITYKFT